MLQRPRYFRDSTVPWADDATVTPVIKTNHGPLVWTPSRVVQIAAECFGVSPDALLSHERCRPLMSYRQVVYAAVKRFCGYSYLSVAAVFHRDHSTVMYGIKKVEGDPHLSELYGLLAEQLLVEGVA